MWRYAVVRYIVAKGYVPGLVHPDTACPSVDASGSRGGAIGRSKSSLLIEGPVPTTGRAAPQFVPPHADQSRTIHINGMAEQQCLMVPKVAVLERTHWPNRKSVQLAGSGAGLRDAKLI